MNKNEAQTNKSEVEVVFCSFGEECSFGESCSSDFAESLLGLKGGKNK